MSLATCNGLPVVSGAVQMPARGIWTASLSVASSEELSGPVALDFDGLALTGTIESGGVVRDLGQYRVVGGAGGWRRSIPALAYNNGAGVKKSLVLRDAATAAGETLGTFTDARLGPSFVRPEGAARAALDLVAPDGWYVDADGVTQIGAWPSAVFSEPLTVLDERADRGLRTVVADSLAGLVPGAVVEGVAVESVRHELGPQGMRSHLLAAVGFGDRIVGALVAAVRAITGRSFFLGSYEYRVISHSGGYLDLTPASAALGLPQLSHVEMRTSTPGGRGQPTPGSTCLVGFVNGDPTRPFVHAFDGAWGTKPLVAALDATTTVELADAVAFAARADLVSAQLGSISTAIAGVGGAYTPGPVAASKVKVS